MEDDKGLDLSLGLPVGGSSSKPKDRNESTTADAGKDDMDRTLKIVNDFKNFLNGGIPQQMPSTSFQRNEMLRPPVSFFSTFHPPSVVAGASGDGNGRRFWNPSGEVEIEGGENGPTPIVGDKRKKSYEELSDSQKRQETEARNPDFPEKGKTSHISITTDDGSTADNEDVAESDAETSKPISNVEDSSKQHVSSASNHSEASKEMLSASTIPPFSRHPVSTLNVPCSITIMESGQVVGGPGPGPGSGSSSYPVPSIMVPSTASGDRAPPSSQGNVTMTFGYSHGQVPSLDKDHPWGLVSRGQALAPFVGRGLSASAPVHVSNPSPSDGKQPIVVEESSLHSRVEDLSKTGSLSFKAKPGPEIPSENGAPLEYPSIRPGLASDLKFGGSGSTPNLPWVSTTGPGPNGRTITGVTYKFSASQIKIVCACHGHHFSPEEFIQHASEEPLLELPGNGENNAATSGAGLASIPVTTTNTASASAKS